MQVIRLAWRYLDDADAWQAREYDVPLSYFGEGSTHDFGWYFEGVSAVPVSDLTAVCEWLAGCEYVRDPDLFNVGDFWQHPRTFEQVRRGDCEDHALWAWRKLCELGIPAELVVGQWLHGAGRGTGHHAWVVFQADGQQYVLETVAKEATTMVREFSEARAAYIPHLSVDAQFTRRIYAGYVRWLQEERERRRAARAIVETHAGIASPAP
jgi:hypothetical protein